MITIFLVRSSSSRCLQTALSMVSHSIDNASPANARLSISSYAIFIPSSKSIPDTVLTLYPPLLEAIWCSRVAASFSSSACLTSTVLRLLHPRFPPHWKTNFSRATGPGQQSPSVAAVCCYLINNDWGCCSWSQLVWARTS